MKLQLPARNVKIQKISTYNIQWMNWLLIINNITIIKIYQKHVDIFLLFLD